MKPAKLIYAVITGAITALFVYLFGVTGNTEEVVSQGHSAILWMIGRWNWAGADMSHGWLIPLVSLYMVWWKKNELLEMSKKLSWLGLCVVILSLLIYLAGLRVQQTRIVLMSLIGLLWGIPFFLFGRHVARTLLYPCAYLVFCIPMTFLDSLTFPLRLLSTTVSVGLLNGLGIAVTQMGTAIQVNAGAGFSLDVAHPCSGLRYLLAMVALTVAYAYFTQNSPVRRTILCVASIPLAMAGNIARITLIALVGTWLGVEFAVGFYHDYSGYVVFVVAILLMLGVSNLLERPWFGRKESAVAQPAHACGMRKPASTTEETSSGPVLLLLMFSVTAIFAFHIQNVSMTVPAAADVRLELPGKVGDWQGEDVFYCQNEQCMRVFLAGELGARRNCSACGGRLDQVSLGERNILPADTIIVRKSYSNAGGEQIFATIVFSGSEQRSIHRPQQCLPAQGFAIERSRVLKVPMDGREPLGLTLIRAKRGESEPGRQQASRMLLAYWFVGGGHETHDHYERLALMAWDNLFHGRRSRWAYVSLQTAEGADSESAEHRIAEFTRRLYPLLKPDQGKDK